MMLLARMPPRASLPALCLGGLAALGLRGGDAVGRVPGSPHPRFSVDGAGVEGTLAKGPAHREGSGLGPRAQGPLRRPEGADPRAG